MPVLIDAQIDRASQDAFFNAMNRATNELGKSTLSSMQWAAKLLCKSLAARTDKSKTRRKVIRNPNQQWKHDRRMSPFGVMGYKGGRESFVPIYPKGNNRNKFYDAATNKWYDRSNGTWEKIHNGPNIPIKRVIPDITQHPKRVIRKSGLAKKTWMSAKSIAGSGGTRGAMGVGRVASVFVDRNKYNPSITIRNKLRYARDAFKSGEGAINSAMSAAAKSLSFNVDRKLDKIASKV